MVLSACNTGLGPLAGWQGVQGLQRGFHGAGVRAVVASLWSVLDDATSIFIEHFSEQMWREKQTPLQAMWLAQLFVARNPARVRQRTKELRELLIERGVSEETLAARGLAKKAGVLPTGSKPEGGKLSPAAWWAAWIVSGKPLR